VSNKGKYSGRYPALMATILAITACAPVEDVPFTYHRNADVICQQLAPHFDRAVDRCNPAPPPTLDCATLDGQLWETSDDEIRACIDTLKTMSCVALEQYDFFPCYFTD
jgi:hypothetical protein